MSSIEMVIVLPLVLLYVFSGLILCISAWSVFLFNNSVERVASVLGEQYAIIAHAYTSHDDPQVLAKARAVMERLPQAICDGAYGLSSCERSLDVCLYSVSLGEGQSLEEQTPGCLSQGGGQSLLDALPLLGCADGGRLGVLFAQVLVPVWWLFFPERWRIQVRAPFLVEAC